METRKATFTKPAMTQNEIDAKFNHEYYAANPETAWDDHLAALHELDMWLCNREYKGIQLKKVVKNSWEHKRTNADNKIWIFVLDGKKETYASLAGAKNCIDNHFDRIAHAARWAAKRAAKEVK